MACYGPLSEGSALVLALVSVSSVPALRMATASKWASSTSGSSTSSSELAATTDADRLRLISSCCARCTSGQGDLRLRDRAVLRLVATEQAKPSSDYFGIPTRVSMGHTGKLELCGEILNVPPLPRMRIEGSYGWNRTAGGLRRPDLPPLPALVELPSRLGRKGCGSCALVAMNVAGVIESGGG